MSRGLLSLLGPLACGGLLLAACSAPPAQPWDGSRSFTSARVATDPPLRSAPLPPRPGPTPAGCEQVVSIIDEFRQQLVRKPPPEGVLETMSGCLLATGRSLELIEMLNEAGRARPNDRALQLRLAAAFVDLEDGDEALRRVERVRSVAPDDPEVLFLTGLVHAGTPGRGPDQLRLARDAWTRMLRIAPGHQGLGRVSPDVIRRELARLNHELGVASGGQAADAARRGGDHAHDHHQEADPSRR